MNSKVIAQKIEKIKQELCAPWSEKITKSLFTNCTSTRVLTPRSAAALAKANDPSNEWSPHHKPPEQDFPSQQDNTLTPAHKEDENAGEKVEQQQQQQQHSNTSQEKHEHSPNEVEGEKVEGKDEKDKPETREDDPNSVSKTVTNEQLPHVEHKKPENVAIPTLSLGENLSDNTQLNSTTTAQPEQGKEEQQAAKDGESRSKQFGEDEVLKERTIAVEFDWNSFNDLFSSLINEGASEVIDTIMESLVSKDCSISLLSSLNDHCKMNTSNADSGAAAYGGKLCKHDMIRSFMQHNLERYVIKYSDDPREWGYFKDGVLCDVVEIDVTDEEEINWIFRDVTQNIENCTDLQQYIINKYYLPLYRKKIESVMYKAIAVEVDWPSIDYAAQDYAKAVYTIYHEMSGFVLEEIFKAFEYIASYEADEFVDAISAGIDTVKIALQPGHDSTRKDFDVNDMKKCLTFRLCLEAEEFAGIFRHKDIVSILKIAGLYNNDYSKVFKFELLSAAASLYKVPRGDLSLFLNILNRKDYFWRGNDNSIKAIEGCKKYIDKYYRDKLAKSDKKKGNNVNNPHSSVDGDDDEEDEEEFEKIIKGWHVIKFNKMNLHQERFLVLTNKAYWTFKFDFKSNSIDEKHFKRHDLLDFCVVDIGSLEQTDQFDIQAMKLFTREKRKADMFGNPCQEVVAVDRNEKKNKKSKMSIELRKSLKLKQSTSGELDLFRQLKGIDFDKMQRPPRTKKTKPIQERPNTSNCYSSVFLPFGEHDVAELKDILMEIAWCIYTAAVARQRTRSQTAEPFLNQTLTKPKESFASFVYNVLGLGIVGKGRKNSAQTKVSLKNLFAKKAVVAEDEPKISEIDRFEPTKNAKPVKPILKKPNAESKYAGTDRHIVFRPEVQVFYHDNDEEEE